MGKHGLSIAERLEAMSISEPNSGCLLWLGCLDDYGYGHLKLVGPNAKAHRLSYEASIGPIPDGLTLDHLCTNKSCIEPTHLEPVTTGENTRRHWLRARLLGFRLLLTTPSRPIPQMVPRVEKIADPNGPTPGQKTAATNLGIPVAEYVAQVEAGNKWCSGHKAWESVERFSPGQYQCRTGGTVSAKAHRKRNPDHYRTYMREYARKRARGRKLESAPHVQPGAGAGERGAVA